MKLFFKIFITVFVSFVAVVSLISYLISVKQISDARNHIIESNKTLGRFLAREIEVGYLQAKWPFESLKKLSEQKDFLFWWIVRNDDIIQLANDVAFMGTEAHSHYPQIAKVTGEENIVLGSSKNYIIFIKTISIENKRWLFCLGFSLKGISVMKKEIVLLDTGITAIGVSVLGFLLYLIIAYLTKPIKELSSGAAIIGKGNLAHRVKVLSHDELGELANSFNNMAEDLQKITVSRDELSKEILERKQAEETLRESEERYRDLVEKEKDIIYSLDDRGNIISASPATGVLLDYRPEELIGRHFITIIPEDWKEKTIGDFNTLLQKGEITAETVLLDKKGHPHFVEYSSTVIKKDNKVVGTRGIVRDITERKKAEEALRASEHKYRTLIENIPQKIFLKDINSVYISCNNNYARDLKIKSDEIIGRTDYDFYPKELAEKYRADDKRIMEAGNTEDIEEKYIQDGREVVVHTVKTPVEDENGNTVGILGIFWDITERKKADDALKNYTRQIEKVNKELDDFTYIVSHDLKEPLRSIDAFSRFVLDDYKDRLDEEGKNYLERIRVNSSRMQNLIEDLLKISRIERKRGSFEEVEAEELVNEARLRLEYGIKEKNAEIIVKDKLPKLFCDRIRLAEVFLNLISNAIKFTDKPNPKIDIGCREKDNFYEFYVKDNGQGIEEQYFDKIFEIFQRLGKIEEHEGTGAGLTIVKKIVQMHRGKIWVDSKVDEGSTFYFTIPKGKEAILGKKKIGEILVEKNLVTEEEVKKALEEQEKMS